MTLRATLRMTAAICGILIMAGSVHASSRRTVLCLKGARTSLKTCLDASKGTCKATFNTDFVNCFGSGSPCATQCQSDQTTCQNPALAQLTACKGAGNPPPAGTCLATLRTALAACKTNPPAGQTAAQCADAASLANFQCGLACADPVNASLAQCNSQFADCVAACASLPPTTTSTTLPKPKP